MTRMLSLIVFVMAWVAGGVAANAQTFDVPATAGWFDTGITIGRDVGLVLNANGRVNFGGMDGQFGPEGTNTFEERPGYLAETERRLGLVARITATADPDAVFRVDFGYERGMMIAIPADASFETGRLWLGINDYDPSNNTGEFSVGVSVLLRDDPQLSVARSAGPARMSNRSLIGLAPARRGVYRVTINGFTCNTETWDHAFEVDGKRDEVFFLTSVKMVNASGATLLESAPMSRTMGDTNHRDWVPPNPGYRIRAGSASRLGGVRTGDRFPSNYPWRRTAAIAPDRPPMLVFEGELVEGVNGVALAPTVWEWDGSPNFLQGWLTAIVDNGAAIGGAIADIVARGQNNGTVVRSALEIGLPALGNLATSIFGNAGDRAIGLEQKSTVGRQTTYTGGAKAIVLNYEIAELARSTNFGKGVGVLELQYRDHRDIGGGWYTLYVQIERLR